MKELTLVLVVVGCVGISGYLFKVPTSPSRTATIGSRGWVHIQKLMVPLFDNVCEESTNPIIVRLAQEFTWDSANYTDPNVITKFRSVQDAGLLSKGEIFSDYDNRHWAELEAIFNVMYNAKDFDTFYNVAAWARQNLNCGSFVNAIYLALINRRDTSKVSVPAPYEILPNYFVIKDVIIKGSNILAGQDYTQFTNVKDEGNAYVIDANYTANVDDNEEDSKLAYFREDIGLNSFYFLRKLKLAPWLNAPLDPNNKYGESMYQTMKQLAARYDLERYANGFPELESIDWDSDIKIYDPMLIYSNGNEFAHRMFNIDVSGSNEIELIKGIENNIGTIVTHMRQSGYHKGQILNNLIEVLVTNNKSYETMARHILGNDIDVTARHFSVLDHLMTTLRDPVFWRLNKKIVDIIDRALSFLPGYTRNELYFPGVEILNVDTKKMMTQFDNFQFDVTEALKTSDKDLNFKLKINQPRLNHKPFVIKLNVSSLVTQKGLVKLYLGPKMAPGELSANKNLFVLLDMFEINLKRGSNIISRSSEEMKGFSNDFVSLPNLRKKIEDAEFGLDSLPLNTVESQIGFPDRLILPRGTPEGLPIRILAFVAPFTKANAVGIVTNSELNSAILSPGYPLDLAIEDHQLLNLPNCLVKDVIITGKGSQNAFAGGENKKYGGGNEHYDPSSKLNYGGRNGVYNQQDDEILEYGEDTLPIENRGLLSLRPDFTKRPESVNNYNSKKGQYGGSKRPEYTYKKTKPYDFSSKNKQYDGKNYSSIITDNNNNSLTTIKTEELQQVDNKEVISRNNDVGDKYSLVSDKVTDYKNLINEGKKRSTIYDYLLPSTEDYYDDKVYE
ncbi:hexamerin [Amyelois transitella]|uniref:hexamerin n=1 Tax=Amyelois transitella TaxID=680683 RepID=UPI002990078E|nr:hexamerin [Amyelois transitella]